jgi:biopolymer transport protein TolQ
MNVPLFLLGAAAPPEMELVYVWNQATPAAKVIIVILVLFSIFAWSVMASKAVQMRRAKKLNRLFDAEFRAQNQVMAVYDRRVQAEGCPLFAVYQAGMHGTGLTVEERGGTGRRQYLSLKAMEHVKRTLERAVAQESLKLESGLILLAIAVSGAPVSRVAGDGLGSDERLQRGGANGAGDTGEHGARGGGSLVTTVAGLLVAIPSMFGYNWLVHTCGCSRWSWTTLPRNLPPGWRRSICATTRRSFASGSRRPRRSK